MGTKEYLKTFHRTNLCPREWSISVTRDSAEKIRATYDGPLILLGAKVCQAFGVAYLSFAVQTSLLGPSRNIVILPHPSGLCRVWNDHKNLERARLLVLFVLCDKIGESK